MSYGSTRVMRCASPLLRLLLSFLFFLSFFLSLLFLFFYELTAICCLARPTKARGITGLRLAMAGRGKGSREGKGRQHVLLGQHQRGTSWQEHRASTSKGTGGERPPLLEHHSWTGRAGTRPRSRQRKSARRTRIEAARAPRGREGRHVREIRERCFRCKEKSLNSIEVDIRCWVWRPRRGRQHSTRALALATVVSKHLYHIADTTLKRSNSTALYPTTPKLA